MPFDIDVIYLLILVAISLILIFGMRALQKTALKELSRTLFEENKPELYAQMLESRRLLLVLRRSTIALLRLDGALYAGQVDGVWNACNALGKLKLRQSERLNWYQKAFSFATLQGDKKHAKDYLARLELLLKNEPDESLQKIRTEAKRLYRENFSTLEAKNEI